MIKQLVALRHEQKKTRVEVAAAIGVTDVSLWYYETEKRDVPFCKMVKWASCLGYDLALKPMEIKL